MNNNYWTNKKKSLVKIINNIQSWSHSGQDIYVLKFLNFKKKWIFNC